MFPVINVFCVCVQGILDALHARLCHGMPLPAGITMDVVAQLDALVSQMFSYMNAPVIARLGTHMRNHRTVTVDSPVVLLYVCVSVSVRDVGIGMLVRDMF